MKLYRVISKDEWKQTIYNKRVPRCASDKRDGFIHLNKLDDIETVANKYFVQEENPVVLEVDITEELKEHIKWIPATEDKNWEQAFLKVDNIEIKFIKRIMYMVYDPFKIYKFKSGRFINFIS
jgi:uncharacterized protein (DUF952 family)